MVGLHGQELGRADLTRVVGDLSAAGSVRLVELSDGAERGVRVLEFRTGSGLAFDVLVDRAFDVGAVEHAGRTIGWRSPTGFRHPGLHDYADEQGWSWLRSFSGLLVTAGLDHILAPAEVDASNYGYQPTAWHPLHGRVSNIPARLLGYGETWTDDDRCVLWAEGEVRQARVFGENLRLRRRIEADLGGNELRLRDEVLNAGSDAVPHMLLYHINVGWPLLAEGSRLLAPIREVLWTTPSVDEQGLSHERFAAPARGLLEQVYEHELVPDATGAVQAAVVNDTLGFGLGVRWNTAELPCFFEWMHLREGAYVVGLEPATHHAGGNQAVRDRGAMVWLEAGEQRSYSLTFSVLEGAPDIAATEDRTRLPGSPS